MTIPAKDDLCSIRELAERFGVTARTLRFYEQKGLLKPARRGATRLYTAADRARLELILRGRRVGFSLEDIREMLEIEQLDHGSRAHMELALERMRERVSVLERQRDDIDSALSELHAGCRWLEERLADREPPEDIKRRARAFEALAAARLTQWAASPPD
ncbi:MerR family DNA-binding transcriptional regulator [Alkalicaulis satelles]|uniref:MerR family DNA-binding transcriptional regulator n=1 Tax=Alkalicaulis satelles TaxID=2609175 RepID=A0A5M6ZRU9_9PROT|nr:MerR family DNA-binding transcriptional regulator [Alkalicaulis satelles]KAA5805011.1 MerR family DNA-binding transcriptional regulator [Alkalicaulis satelles]